MVENEVIAVAVEQPTASTIVESKGLKNILVSELLGHKMKLLDETSLPYTINTRTYYSIKESLTVKDIIDLGLSVCKIKDNKVILSFTKENYIVDLLKLLVHDKPQLLTVLTELTECSTAIIPYTQEALQRFIKTLSADSEAIKIFLSYFLENAELVPTIIKKGLNIVGTGAKIFTEDLNILYDLLSSLGIDRVEISSVTTFARKIVQVQSNALFIHFANPIDVENYLSTKSVGTSKFAYLCSTVNSTTAATNPCSFRILDEVALRRHATDYHCIKDGTEILAMRLNNKYFTTLSNLTKRHTGAVLHVLRLIVNDYMSKNNFSQGKIDTFNNYFEYVEDSAYLRILKGLSEDNIKKALTTTQNLITSKMVELGSLNTDYFVRQQELEKLDNVFGDVLETLNFAKNNIPIVEKVRLFPVSKPTPALLLMIDTRMFLFEPSQTIIPGLRIGIRLDNVYSPFSFSSIEKHLFFAISPTPQNILLNAIMYKNGKGGVHPHVRVHPGSSYTYEREIFENFYTNVEKAFIKKCKRLNNLFGDTQHICFGSRDNDLYHALCTHDIGNIVIELTRFITQINDDEAWGRSVYTSFLSCTNTRSKEFFSISNKWNEDDYKEFVVNVIESDNPGIELTPEALDDLISGRTAINPIFKNSTDYNPKRLLYAPRT